MTCPRFQEKRSRGKDPATNNLMGATQFPLLIPLSCAGLSPKARSLCTSKIFTQAQVTQSKIQSSCGNCSFLTPTLNFILGSTYSYTLPNPQILVVDQGVEIYSHWAKPRASSWSLNFKPVSISLVPLQSRILSVAVSHHEKKVWSAARKYEAIMHRKTEKCVMWVQASSILVAVAFVHSPPWLLTADLDSSQLPPWSEGKKRTEDEEQLSHSSPTCYLGASVPSPLGGATTVEVVLRLRFRFCTFCSGWNRMT